MTGFGWRLHALRHECGLSREAPLRVGLDRTSISKLERPTASPRLAAIQRLADALDVRTRALLEDD
jgi:transcriptional regulator with XRE-family HTH domain